MQNFVHGGNIYTEKPLHGDWLDFSANINPLGLSVRVKQAIEEGIKGLINYPEPECRSLKNVLANKYCCKENNILVGNGAAELFYLFMHAFRPHKVLLPVPSFSEYERASLAVGAQIDYLYLVAENNFCLKENIVKQNLSGHDCLFLGNPNNPTGNLYHKDFVEKIVQAAAKENIWVVVDESFLEFLPDDSRYSVRDLVKKYKNLFVIQSLTKFYAIPGLRLGLCFMDEEGIEKLGQQHDPWNVNYLAQQAGMEAIKDKAYIVQSQKYILNERAFLYMELKKMKDIKVYEPSVNYLFIELGRTWQSSKSLAAKMREKGILIRDCANYPGLGENFIRIAVKSHADNVKLLSTWREILEEVQ